MNLKLNTNKSTNVCQSKWTITDFYKDCWFPKTKWHNVVPRTLAQHLLSLTSLFCHEPCDKMAPTAFLYSNTCTTFLLGFFTSFVLHVSILHPLRIKLASFYFHLGQDQWNVLYAVPKWPWWQTKRGLWNHIIGY